MNLSKAERVDRIEAGLLAGRSFVSIGDEVGVCAERIRQIAREFGFVRIKPEKPPKIRKERAVKYGDIRRKCKSDGLPDPYRKFVSHKDGAGRRGIPFRMTFEEWWGMWEPHYARRGTRRGCMVMCRHYDTGAYEVGNVSIRTVTENQHEKSLVYHMRHTTWHRKWPKKTNFRAVQDEDDPAE